MRNANLISKKIRNILTKQLWRQRWLKSINELTSLEFQQKTWLDLNNPSLHYSFTEFMNSYFDDLLSGYEYPFYIIKGWLTQQEYDTISEWHMILDQYESPNRMDNDNLAILNDINWIGITDIGCKAKNNLIKFLDNTEILLLENL